MDLVLLFYLNLLIVGLLIIIIFNLQKMFKQVRISDNLEDILVDTSALIDGRISEVVKYGFIIGKFLVPEFILKELQKVADSSDPIRRKKGRDGLKTLRDLQKMDNAEVEILDEDFPEIKYVDEKIVKLAKIKKATILTVDFNLNNVAKVHNLRVLNINELANALRPLFIPGEKLEIKIVQRGKEGNQGVGYLEDGTMVVVEDGMKYLHQKIECIVSRILQTDAGRMVFARPASYGLDRIGGGKIQHSSKKFLRFVPSWQIRRKNHHKNNHNN